MQNTHGPAVAVDQDITREAHGLGRHCGDFALVTAFALKGLLGRKLRTALTAIAIVLGVAMISGTYVLTDSIAKLRRDLHAESTRERTRSITGKSAFDLSSSRTTTAPPFDESLLAKVRALPDVDGGDRRRRRRGAADRQERQGDRLRRRAEPRLQRRPDAAARSTRSRSSAAAGRRRDEVVVDESTAGKKHIKIGQTDRRAGARAPSSGFGSRASSSSARSRTIGGATLAGFDLADRAAPLRQDGQARPDPRRLRSSGVSPERARRGDPARSCRPAPR